MQNLNPITISVKVTAPIEKVWQYWNAPEHITHWAFASDDWECPAAENDLREGGTLKVTMAAKDGSTSFDIIGVYTEVKENSLIEYVMEDGRKVRVEFVVQGDQVEIVETFDPEQENSEELQRDGWQAILNNLKKHVSKL